jgi:hypothetical protein
MTSIRILPHGLDNVTYRYVYNKLVRRTGK